jgi:chemosensory pili system protein ChpB (putative protein-glutamate methylesterase)
MTDTAPAVALLFDDTELGGQLRAALHERGARIVHEGGVSSLSRELLQRVGADVLVVNLDDGADDALDQLYEVIDGDRPRVVFNDAQASRALIGWDRARWARHLAVKVLADGDVDPPRPDDARGVEMPPEVLVEAAQIEVPAAPVEAALPDTQPVEAGEESPIRDMEPASEAELEPDFLVHDDPEQHEQTVAVESENLAAELEALLASGELSPDDKDGSGPGLRYFDDEDLPPLHDGNFGQPATVAALESSHAGTYETGFDETGFNEAGLNEAGFNEMRPVETLSGVTPAAFRTDHLQLSALTDPSVATTPASAAEPVLTGTPSVVRAPSAWALLDDDAASAASAVADKPDATAFGIEKLSAADFLAPDVEPVAHDMEAVMSLELVSMEEAIAPQAYVHDQEMVLDVLGSALSRVVLLGAAISGTDSVCSFLAALPASTRLTFLHTQHHGGQSSAALVEKLAAHCALPVRLAVRGIRTGVGEVLVVPVGQEVRLRRDGSIELLPDDAADAMQEPSIDASLTMAANAFGRDALAIVFAGRGNDAVAGAQAIHDRGGQVWVESSSGDHFADMVSGIFAERLVSFSGTPPELAAHLIEVFS